MYKLRTNVFCIVAILFAALGIPYQTTGAGLLPIGSPCETNRNCASEDCEFSTKVNAQGQRVSFCDCNYANDCAARYGVQAGQTWSCVDGANATYDLDYCLDDMGRAEPPIAPRDPSFFDHILDPTLSASTLNEVQQILQPPQPRISIPGLTFSSPADVVQLTETDIAGQTYLNIPFLGQYIAAFYRYAVAGFGAWAAVMLIVHGFNIVVSAGASDKIEASKKRIGQVMTALLLVLGSYSLLYFINPELVRFRSLRVLYIARQEFDGSESTGEKETGQPGKCGGAAGNQQILFPALVGSVHPLISYSTKYGDTCKKIIQPRAIVLHFTGGNKDTAAGVVKFWSDKDKSPGTVCQIIVDTAGVAYQATDRLDEKVICHGGKEGAVNWNSGGIGIEIVGGSEKTLLKNTAQKDAVVALVNTLANTYNISKTNDVNNLLNGTGGIFTHEQITRCQGASKQKHDPGEQYAQEIMEQIGGIYIDWEHNQNCQKT